MSKVLPAVAATVLLLAVVFGAMSAPQGGALAAPPAAPTPVSVTRPASNDVRIYEIWNNEAITEDTTAQCVDIGAAGVIDAQYQIDQTDVNTVTLTTQWSINASLITDGVDLVTGNAADGADLVQVQAFGRFLCPMADVTNGETVTVTLFVAAK